MCPLLMSIGNQSYLHPGSGPDGGSLRLLPDEFLPPPGKVIENRYARQNHQAS